MPLCQRLSVPRRGAPRSIRRRRDPRLGRGAAARARLGRFRSDERPDGRRPPHPHRHRPRLLRRAADARHHERTRRDRTAGRVRVDALPGAAAARRGIRRRRRVVAVPRERSAVAGSGTKSISSKQPSRPDTGAKGPLSALLTARGAPPPLALARRLRASLGPQGPPGNTFEWRVVAAFDTKSLVPRSVSCRRAPNEPVQIPGERCNRRLRIAGCRTSVRAGNHPAETGQGRQRRQGCGRHRGSDRAATGSNTATSRWARWRSSNRRTRC